MDDLLRLQKILSVLPLGGLRYFPMIDSTNNEAQNWISQGAPDLSLIVANEQTAGRGRMSRKWITPPNSALAFTLILHPHNAESAGQYTALGAIALCKVLIDEYNLPAVIKWPNDVLVFGKKTAGILVEMIWIGECLDSILVGIGVNITPQSVPTSGDVQFPVSCLEKVLEHPIDRWELLQKILRNILYWRTNLGKPVFMDTWNSLLAWRDEWVQATIENTSNPQVGHLIGVGQEGELILKDPFGKAQKIHMGELLHLRRYEPVD